MSTASELVSIREHIESLIERLDDVAFQVLREAARDTGTRPASDKTLTQARRAMEKAARLLGGLEDESD